MNKLVDLFLKIIQIDSPSGSEERMIKFVSRYLNRLGLNHNIDEEGNVYVRVKGKGDPILFCAHLDTVEPGRNISPKVKNGIIRSEGESILGADNKAFVAVILHSLARNIKKGRSLEIIFSVREETDSGISNFDLLNVRSKVGFVFDLEGDVGTMVSSAPFIDDFTFEINGKASHCSNPENGINALATFLRNGKKLKLGRVGENSTFNIGLIKGGSSTNTVPEKLILKGDLRSHNSSTFEEIKRKYERMLSDSAGRIGTTVDFNWTSYSEGYKHNLKSENIRRLTKIYKQHGMNLKFHKAESGSDANSLNERGIETYCLSYGAQKTHTTSEYISVEQLVKLQQIVEKIILKY